MHSITINQIRNIRQIILQGKLSTLHLMIFQSSNLPRAGWRLGLWVANFSWLMRGIYIQRRGVSQYCNE